MKENKAFHTGAVLCWSKNKMRIQPGIFSWKPC